MHLRSSSTRFFSFFSLGRSLLELVTFLPKKCPGERWVERQGQRLSTLDLLDGPFVLLTGSGGVPWCEAVSAVAEQLGIRLLAYRLGPDGNLLDRENGWQAKMGVSPDGAVLIRPDGFVAWRSKTLAPLPQPLLKQVLEQVLGRSMAPMQSNER